MNSDLQDPIEEEEEKVNGSGSDYGNEDEQRENEEDDNEDEENKEDEVHQEEKKQTTLEEDEEINLRALIRVDTRDETIRKDSDSLLIKHRTLGLSTTHSEITYFKMRDLVKQNKRFLEKILKNYREIDNKEYDRFISLKVRSKKVQRVFNEYYLLHENFAECAMIFLLNSYDETGISRLYQAFYLEFDENNDLKMQIEEMEKCIEFLGKDSFIGKTKMIKTLAELGIDCKNNLSFFQEGGAANKILNEETANQLFQMMKYIDPTRVNDPNRKIDPSSEHIDFYKFAPIITIFFLEYMVRIFLKKKAIYQLHLGFPYKINEKGMEEIIPNGEPSGLYRAFVTQLKGENDVTKPVLTFRIVSKALIAYRSSGFSESLTMDAVERIIKKVRDIMSVDPISGNEKRKFTMEELLPFLSARIATETTWSTTKFRRSIEKYDHLVNWLGGALCMDLRKEKLDAVLKDAFCNNMTPTFEQFVKGLDFILKRSIPTLDSPAAIFIAQKLMNTPDAIIQGVLTEDSKTRIRISYLVEEDNIYQRLYHYTMNTQITLMFVRLLYKNHYHSYKKFKRINRRIREYNDIMKINHLFDTVPGKLGNFEEKGKILKNDDAEELKKEIELRNEMKKKKFLESLLSKDTSNTRRKSLKRTMVAAKNLMKSTDRSDTQSFQREENLRIMKLQAQANEIDRLISAQDIEKDKIIRNTKESNAFANDSDITPDMILSLIKYTNNKSEVIEKLQEFIYTEKEKVNYQDIVKFIIAEDIRARGQDDEVISKASTKYVLKDFSETENKNTDEKSKFELEKFEEDLFEELKNQFTLKNTESNLDKTLKEAKEEKSINERKDDKSRGCECLVI